MVGHETQARRPISVALALRDLLAETAEKATIVSSDGRVAPTAELIEPVGDTSLAASHFKEAEFLYEQYSNIVTDWLYETAVSRLKNDG